MCENKPAQEPHTMQNSAIILMTPASLKSYSKDYQRHDNSLGFNQECILKNVFKSCIYVFLYPFKPQFYNIKVGCRGYTLNGHIIMMKCQSLLSAYQSGTVC